MPRLTIADTDVDLRLQPGETILAGLHRAGYAANTGCLRGGCGICKVDVIQGSVSYPQTVAETVLTQAERADGVCLICRAVPEQDTSIAVGPGFKLRCVAPFLATLARRR
jgi:ferredoxin